MIKFPENTIPSELTVEVLTNHLLLSKINKPSAWIFVPTRREEKKIGYDASLQNIKVAVIQYKRLTVAVPDSGAYRIKINENQHTDLLKNFPKVNMEYVFYAFSLCQTYEKINDCFTSKTSWDFLKQCVFINAHDLPLNSKTIIPLPYNSRVKKVLPLHSVSIYGNSSHPVQSYDGVDFVSKLVSCKIGLINNDIDLGNTPPSVTSSRVNILRFDIN